MNNDNTLTYQQKKISEELRKNYIIHYANLIVDNIAVYYKYYNNNCNLSLINIKQMAKDSYKLNDDENKELNFLIKQYLKNRHSLKLISDYEDSILTLENLK